MRNFNTRKEQSGRSLKRARSAIGSTRLAYDQLENRQLLAADLFVPSAFVPDVLLTAFVAQTPIQVTPQLQFADCQLETHSGSGVEPHVAHVDGNGDCNDTFSVGDLVTLRDGGTRHYRINSIEAVSGESDSGSGSMVVIRLTALHRSIVGLANVHTFRFNAEHTGGGATSQTDPPEQGNDLDPPEMPQLRPTNRSDSSSLTPISSEGLVPISIYAPVNAAASPELIPEWMTGSNVNSDIVDSNRQQFFSKKTQASLGEARFEGVASRPARIGLLDHSQLFIVIDTQSPSHVSIAASRQEAIDTLFSTQTSIADDAGRSADVDKRSEIVDTLFANIESGVAETDAVSTADVAPTVDSRHAEPIARRLDERDESSTDETPYDEFLDSPQSTAFLAMIMLGHPILQSNKRASSEKSDVITER